MESSSFVVTNSFSGVANLLLNVLVWFPQLGPSWSLYIPAPQHLRQHHRPRLSVFRDGIRYLTWQLKETVSSWLRVLEILVCEQSACAGDGISCWKPVGMTKIFSPHSWGAKKGVESWSSSLLYWLTPELGRSVGPTSKYF